MSHLHHVAITVADYERYIDLFQKLGMTVQKTRGEAPDRQLWFEEGIQLKEAPEGEARGNVDHIALGVTDKKEIMRIALENGCSPLPKGDKWFALPNGVSIELMEE